MYFHHNSNLAWLSIAKNASTSWISIFDSMSWQKEDLYDPVVDINKLTFFGFLRDPNDRHTMGIVEYLARTGQRELINDPAWNRLLVSGLFDEHSYTVSHLIPGHVLTRTTFFILDQSYFNYEVLTKNYLRNHGVELNVPVPKLWIGDDSKLKLRNQINELKQVHKLERSFLAKNFLEPDQLLYKKHLLLQNNYHCPGDPVLTK